MDSIKEKCYKIDHVGQIRLGIPEVDSISIICIPDHNPTREDLFGEEVYESELEKHFKPGFAGMVKNGPRYKKFRYPIKYESKGSEIRTDIVINLYVTHLADYGRMMAIRTGSKQYTQINHVFRWGRLGYVATEQGLFTKENCVKVGDKWQLKPGVEEDPPVFETEEKFYEFLELTMVSPRDRNWKDKHNKRKNVKTRNQSELFR